MVQCCVVQCCVVYSGGQVSWAVISRVTLRVQNFARRHRAPIDTVSFSFRILDTYSAEGVTAAPADGCYIHGLFLEGARWDGCVAGMRGS